MTDPREGKRQRHGDNFDIGMSLHIDWEDANEEIPGIERLLSRSIANIRTARGELYDPEGELGDGHPKIDRDESCWTEWDGHAFEFHWGGSVRRFVTRDLHRGSNDCVLERSATINEPIACCMLEEFDAYINEKGGCTEWAEKHPSSVWKLAGFVVDTYSTSI